MSKTKRITALLLAGIIAAASITGIAADGGDGAADSGTDRNNTLTVELGEYKKTLEATGKEYFPLVSTVKYKGGSGKVSAVYVTGSDITVTAGQKLYEIIPDVDEFALNECRIDLKNEKAAYEVKIQSFKDELKELNDEKKSAATSTEKKKLDIKIQLKKMEQEEYEETEAKALAKLEDRLAELEMAGKPVYITAPIAGEVVDIKVASAGGEVTDGKQMCSIQDLSKRMVTCSKAYPCGEEVDLECKGMNSGEKVVGRVVVSSSVVPGLTDYSVIEIDGSKTGGYRWRKITVTGVSKLLQNIILIPSNVRTTAGEASFVRVLNEKNEIVKKKIIEAEKLGSDIWVISGLSAGERLVVD